MFKAYGKDQNVTFVGETTPRLNDKILSVMVSSNADVTPLQTADRIDVFENTPEERLTASYKIVGWKAVERLWDGIRVTWQTFSEDELDSMQKQLDETKMALDYAREMLSEYEMKIKLLTNAMLDLASVVGTEEESADDKPDGAVDSPEGLSTEAEEKPKRRRRKKEEAEDG